MAEDKSTKRAHNFKDIAGHRFGTITVLHISTTGKRMRWRCQCDCGTVKDIEGRHLRSGRVVSCGCYRNANAGSRTRTHGLSATKEYDAWSDAKTRCFNKNSQQYHHYGGRGITMSEDWKQSFETFLADIGPCKPGMSLDRIDVNGPYSKDNCRWVSHTEQMRNQRKNILVTYDGETLPLWEWSRRSGIPMKILNGRHQRGTAILGPRTRRWRKRPTDQ